MYYLCVEVLSPFSGTHGLTKKNLKTRILTCVNKKISVKVTLLSFVLVSFINKAVQKAHLLDIKPTCQLSLMIMIIIY
jgi:hypothetical protein